MSETEPHHPPLLQPVSSPDESTGGSSSALVVAILWALLAGVFAMFLLTNAKEEFYGGDAYTGIQNAVVWAVRGIAFLLIGSGALGIIIATRRDRR